MVLTNVTIPNSVTSIGDNAFAVCPKLKNIYFLGDAPGDELYSTAIPVRLFTTLPKYRGGDQHLMADAFKCGQVIIRLCHKIMLLRKLY